jgi:hypothetical protein
LLATCPIGCSSGTLSISRRSETIDRARRPFQNDSDLPTPSTPSFPKPPCAQRIENRKGFGLDPILFHIFQA